MSVFRWLYQYLRFALFMALATVGVIGLVWTASTATGLNMSPRNLWGELEWVFSAPFRLVGLVTGYFGQQMTVHGIGAVQAISGLLVAMIALFPVVPLSFFYWQGKTLWRIWVFAGVLVIYWAGYAMDQFCNSSGAILMFDLGCPWYR